MKGQGALYSEISLSSTGRRPVFGVREGFFRDFSGSSEELRESPETLVPHGFPGSCGSLIPG